jgi:hypothetical protein
MRALILICAVGAAAIPIGAEDADRVYSVCELLASPNEFDGKAVKVRGDVEGGFEGAWLESKDCPEQFYAEGYSLPKKISLAYRSAFGREAVRNEKHIRQVEDRVKHSSKNAKSDLAVIRTGIFETRKVWMILTLASGEKQLWGFGHLNGFPAQLVVTDLDVIDKSVKGKGGSQP